MRTHLKNAHRNLKNPEYLRIFLLRAIGNFLLLSSCFMVGKTFYQPISAEFWYYIDQAAHKQYVVSDKKTNSLIQKEIIKEESAPKGLLANIFHVAPIEILHPVDPNFSIVIPKIGANARVLPNVNPANENEYLSALKVGVAHAAGTAFPGEPGHIFLFAHSTDYFWNIGTYNAIFYLLYKLEQGDEVNLFYEGHRHVYKVVAKQIVDPSQIEYITRKSDKEFLTMQTCWPPGTTLKRQLVFAVPVSE